MLKSVPARIIFWQFSVGLLGTVIWLFAGGQREALAALFGGSIGPILSLYFAVKVFSHRGGTDPRAMAGAFFRAEALKLVLAAVLFSTAAVLFSDVFIPLITTFMATLIVYWFALIWNMDNG
ncbi:MAG: ATP synthase subunit I [Gammaproteobacteria bacterium]|nr:ATP synthase subunit I [Gammaproteobacteria bacterium]